MKIIALVVTATVSALQVPSSDFYQNDLRSRQTFKSGGPCDLAYVDSGLRIGNIGDDMSCQFNVYEAGYFANNVSVEVSAALVRGSTESGFGIKFGNANADNTHYYYFAINANGGYRMSLRSDGRWHELMDFYAGDKVNRGLGQWNRLRVDLNGRDAQVYVNGQWVAGTQLSTMPIGRVGFYLNDPGMEVVFRDLRVSELPNAVPTDAASSFVYQYIDAAMKEGDFDGAERQARIYTRSFPGDARGHRAHSFLLLIAGDEQAAAAAARRAVTLSPRDPEYRAVLGSALLSIDDADGAISELREAIRLGSKSSNVYRQLADTLLKKNQPDESLQTASQALALAQTPDEKSGAYTAIGLARLAKQDIAGAMQQLREGVRSAPRHAPAHYALGQAYEKSGQRREALEAYRTALELAPKSEQYQAAVRRLTP